MLFVENNRFHRELSDNHLSNGEKIDRLCTVIPCAVSLFGTLVIIASVCGFFSGSISGSISLMITRRSYKLTQLGLLKLTVAIFLVALGLALIPLSTNQYQNIGAECWIAGQGENGTTVRNGTIMRFATHYSLIWSICLFCAWCYLTIFKYIQELREALRMSVKTVDGERSEVEKTVYRLQYYPAILIGVWLPITACRIYSSIYPNHTLTNWALGGSHALVNSQGWLNALVFCSCTKVG